MLKWRRFEVLVQNFYLSTIGSIPGFFVNKTMWF
jgi:hypothetical protein